MNLSYEFVLAIGILMIYFDIVLVCALFISKLRRSIDYTRFESNQKKLLSSFAQNKQTTLKGNYLDCYKDLKESVIIDSEKQLLIEKDIGIIEKENGFIKKLKSPFKIKRIDASVNLALIATSKSRLALHKALIKEKDLTVKLYIANALADIGDPSSIKVMIESLISMKKWYREKVNMLISDFGKSLFDYLPKIIYREELEIKELIVDFSSGYYSETLKHYLLMFINNFEEESMLYQAESQYISQYKRVIYKAAEVMATYYYNDFSKNYMSYSDVILKNYTVKALAQNGNNDSLYILIKLLEDEKQSRTVINSISKIIEKNPSHLQTVSDVFMETKSPAIKSKIAEVLSNRIEYYILKLLSTQEEKAESEKIIASIIDSGMTSKLIAFLNNNKNISLENELVKIIKQINTLDENTQKDFCKYLNEDIVIKCNWEKSHSTISSREKYRSKKMIPVLWSLLVFSILIIPVVYSIRHYPVLFTRSYSNHLKTFVLEFNYYIVFYTLAINIIYLVLFSFSLLEVYKQKKLWKLKNMTFLFKKNMLPSISIIAAAYNEEKTIIESANSLLNLKYPDYELIIVNDGSNDNTLKILIDHFELTRIDFIVEGNLDTMPIRGIYKNASNPTLLIVDKDNGGKADSLNTGINVSTKEYFCGIDADSLLDEYALLKLASLTLDQGIEIPALGGNVFPINGCKVEKGVLSKISIPKNNLARFQTIEYIRAFMAGRLGWSRINGLLIISGAFGLFRRERIISAGGYLSKRGRYGLDTMGEDMELVVRVTRLMRELKLKYKINYAFNANCWTQVPEDIKSLKKQRLRWHRGLVEILTFHRKLVFNPKYGKTGLLSIPYFFIFELLGPLFEVQGYAMVIIAFFIGLLNFNLALLLFIANILFGVLVSLAALYISEKDSDYFDNKDVLILLLYAVLENFGVRQWWSMWRVTGVINLLKNPGGVWEKAKRKYFDEHNTSGIGGN